MKINEPIVEHILNLKGSLLLLKQHHLVGLFSTHYSFLNLPNSCSEQYQNQWIHNQVLMEELEHIGQLIGTHQTTATILKGCHLLCDLYSDPGSRFMSDIDLLIPLKDIHVWEKMMKSLGYHSMTVQTFYGNNYKSEWSKHLGEVEINVELHTKLFYHHQTESWKLEQSKYANLSKLSHEHLYIHLCGHLAFQHNFLKLNWLFDIYLWHQKYEAEMNWNELKSDAIEMELYQSVRMCLWAMIQHFHLKIDDDVIKIFNLNEHSWRKSLLTTDFLLNPYHQKIRYLLVKHATKDSLMSALRYDLAWFFHYKIRKTWQRLKA